MLIKHFNDLAKLIDVKITDFTGLRHNWWAECVSLQDASDVYYLDGSERLVRILDRVHLTETSAQTVWCLNVAYHCIGSVLQTSTLRRGVVFELVGIVVGTIDRRWLAAMQA